MKCCLLTVVLLLALIPLQVEAQTASPTNESTIKPPMNSTLAVQAEAAASTATPTSDETPLTPAPKGIVVGGPLIDLFKRPNPTTTTEPEGPPAPIVGLDLFNPFVPKPEPEQPPTDWTGKRPQDQRSLKPKKAQFQGINLFSIKF